LLALFLVALASFVAYRIVRRLGARRHPVT
jgi:hypothetical protein